ncbi:MAG: 30S ribosomal protein S19e [Nitrososphaerota archaeon]|nr:30S ribosomal protein S19e [Candidatus Bathyarchaeota archaeon]MCX8162760.1 30S ribosomal protein S19e [Candidatus Bathyarchaeota archaeon]MDW8061355.1 30S ribosomal protein S19e [Nitrososphaerota archaeon]
MTSVYEVHPTDLLERMAEVLKGVEEITPPPWFLQVKTGVAKEKAPEKSDWWYIRAASILRKIYIDGPIGIEKLACIYSDRRRRGRAPAHSRKASRKIIRAILLQLERAGLVEKYGNKGRVLTSKGRSLLDRIAHEVSKRSPIPEIGRYYEG